MSCSRSHRDQCWSGTWSPKSPFSIFANPALPHTESDLSFSPYTPEGVFTVSALPSAMIQSLFFFQAETLADLFWQPSGHTEHSSIQRSKSGRKISTQSLKCVLCYLLILRGGGKKKKPVRVQENTQNPSVPWVSIVGAI